MNITLLKYKNEEEEDAFAFFSREKIAVGAVRCELIIELANGKWEKAKKSFDILNLLIEKKTPDKSTNIL